MSIGGKALRRDGSHVGKKKEKARKGKRQEEVEEGRGKARGGGEERERPHLWVVAVLGAASLLQALPSARRAARQ